MSKKAIVAEDLRIRQITRQNVKLELEAGLRVALTSLQKQITNLYNNFLLSQNTTATSASGANIGSNVVELTNASGAGRNSGDVVTLAGTASSFTTTTTAGDEEVIGVVYSDSPDGVADAIANGAAGYVCVGGLANIKVDADAHGGITPASPLVSHTVAGYACKSDHINDPGVFALSLESLPSGTGEVAGIIMPRHNYNTIRTEWLTASSPSQVTLSEAPYIDELIDCYVLIADFVNFKVSFSTARNFGSPDRAVLTAAGAVVTNSAADFSTDANALRCWYLRNLRETGDAAILFNWGFVLPLINVFSLTAATGIFPIKYQVLRTYDRQLLDALNELETDLRKTVKKQLRYDANDMLVSADWLWSAADSVLCRHYIYSYDADGLLEKIRWSQMDTAGAHKLTVTQTLVYVGGMLDNIVREITA